MTEQDPFNLENLIRASEIESAAVQEELDSNGNLPAQRRVYIKQPVIVAFSWFICVTVAVFMYLVPAYPNRAPGGESIEKRLGTAVYHAAHRVETYRRKTGSLPDYLDPDWHEGRHVSYEVVNDHYIITGQLGDLTIRYAEGENPEALLGRQPTPAEIPIEQ